MGALCSPVLQNFLKALVAFSSVREVLLGYGSMPACCKFSEASSRLNAIMSSSLLFAICRHLYTKHAKCSHSLLGSARFYLVCNFFSATSSAVSTCGMAPFAPGRGLQPRLVLHRATEFFPKFVAVMRGKKMATTLMLSFDSSVTCDQRNCVECVLRRCVRCQTWILVL